MRGFKCFLTDSGNPNFPHLTPGQFRQAMARIAELDSVLLVHAESHDVIEGSPRPRGRGYSSFLASRPDAAEEDAVALVMDAAAATGARAHVVHVSSGRVLALLAEAKRPGVRVTAETCPHYLTFAAEDIPDGATEFAACPPIRGSANRDLLWGGLLDGTLDMVVSDHSPCAPEYKGDGDFGRVFGGISSLQLGPRAVWTHAAQRGFGLADLSRWMSEGPAALAGLVDRGRIAVGLRADLCVFDPDAEEVIDAGALRHRHPVSPYDGWRCAVRCCRPGRRGSWSSRGWASRHENSGVEPQHVGVDDHRDRRGGAGRGRSGTEIDASHHDSVPRRSIRPPRATCRQSG